MDQTKVILFMAMSVNGIVAREDDAEDFLPEYGWEKFVELANRAGGFIIGRRTYTLVRENYEDGGFDSLKDLIKIVVSKSQDFEHASDIMIAGSIRSSIKIARSKGLKEIILTGGPSINSQFAEMGLIDEVIFNLESVVVGRGISVFKPLDFDLKLELLSFTSHIAGGLTLHYKVMK